MKKLLVYSMLLTLSFGVMMPSAPSKNVVPFKKSEVKGKLSRIELGPEQLLYGYINILNEIERDNVIIQEDGKLTRDGKEIFRQLLYVIRYLIGEIEKNNYKTNIVHGNSIDFFDNGLYIE